MDQKNETEQAANGFRLSAPLEYEGKTYETLTLDFDSLTGKQIEAIDTELRMMGASIVTPELDHRYQVAVAAKAAGVPKGLFQKMNAKDYLNITRQARTFLLGTG